MRKVFLAILIVFSLVLLSSCGNKSQFELTEEILNHNINVPTKNDLSSIQSNYKVNLSEYNYVNTYYAQGLVVVRNQMWEEGVYSLAESRLIVPIGDYDITVNISPVMGAYIYLLHPDGKRSVYDIGGVKVIEEDHYYAINLNFYKSNVFDDDGKVVGVEYIETRAIITDQDYQEQGLIYDSKNYLVDIKTKQRTLIQDEDSLQRGDFMDRETISYQDLETFGLEGYKRVYHNNVFKVYNSENQLVSSFSVPNQQSNTKISTHGGHVFYQTLILLPLDSEDFDAILNGNKYQITNRTIDMKTGESSRLDLDYLITSINPFKDENGVINYAQVTTFEIIDGVVNNDIEYRYIIDGKGTIIKNIDGIRFFQLVRLDSETLYDKDTSRVLNNSLEPLFQIPLTHVVNYNEEIIIFRQNGLYGAISFHGEVLIPFEFSTIDNSFYEGYTLATDAYNLQCIISVDGIKNCYASIRAAQSVTGAYLMITVADGETPIQYLYELYHYNGTKLLETTATAPTTAVSSYIINNPYYNAEFIVIGYQHFVVHYDMP